jgi:hypothetical protein
MSLALQSHVLDADQLQVDLMHQCGRLHDGFLALPLHKVYGQAVKFLVNTRCQGIERGRIAARPCEEKLCRITAWTVGSQTLGNRVTFVMNFFDEVRRRTAPVK